MIRRPGITRAIVALIATLASSVARAQTAPVPVVAFQNAALGARFAALWTCITPPSGWVPRVVAPAPIGAYWWCPAGEARCGDYLNPPAEFYVLRVRTGREGELLELLARRRMPDGTVVTVSLQPWTGGFDFTFQRGAGSVSLSSTASYQGHDQNLTTSPRHLETADLGRWLDAELAPWLRGERAFRDEGVALMNRLRQAIADSVRRHQLTTCDTPHHIEFTRTANGESGSETCVQRPLTAGEERALVRDADREIDARIAFVRANHRAMYAALQATARLDRCAPPH